ncbi:excinuclease ABC subunit UvrC [Catenulispora sp. NF23]|uniref:UvrABC system protein C n=1 Tax=Catenulispora pinistramenti TaxID=2705254 RepID=A0ABS5KZY7_9ACTN|nr:excinuclease ABC subunit UvrC [Catenulispora pinistramenti]MBS2536798.1 excinuclease ABC subunit UvrC [Catenulispora pinistramenti]MBS2551552.1 excinuclease ABC subunit UvrC [Catenulispora pinistramenti]
MADPATYRPKAGEIPTSPGVYKFRDPHGRVIYVGKAKNLRSRLTSYFQDLANLHVRTQTMVTTAASVEWTTVSTEVEALQLEYTWIKQFEPRFNVKYRDDKSYPSLAVTVGEEYPRAQVMRGPKRTGVRYFGPYSHAWAIRETLDSLLRVFPIRTCSSGVFKRAAQTGRPCLLGYIGKCSAPCVGRVSAEEHREIVEDFVTFMAGRTDRYIKGLEDEMKQAAKEMEYEKAARLRDDLQALRQTLEKNAVVLGDGTDADVIALAEDPLEAAVQVFHVRGGRIRGQRGWVVDRVEDVDTAGLVEHFMQQLYGSEQGEQGVDTETVPREILVPELPGSLEAITQWLTDRRGAKVEVRVPKRGDKAALMETVAQNAKQSLVLHKTRRASDLTTRSVALQELAEAIGMDQAPLRIECYDISHLQGTNVVASMVVFEDGLPRKSEYRRFTIKGSDENGATNDDVRNMHEVITRRFKAFLKEQEEEKLIDETTGERKKFAYPPQLVVVDGGQPQVAAAARALADLEISDVTLVGLAKRLEEVWLPDEDDPVLLPRSSEGLYLLQRVRDEAHRFGIAFHRQKRSKSMVASALDDVPGLGEVRRKALLAHFGTLRKLRAAQVAEIAEVPGIGPATARQIHSALAELPASRAVNAATGEILEGGESRIRPDEE